MVKQRNIQLNKYWNFEINISFIIYIYIICFIYFENKTLGISHNSIMNSPPMHPLGRLLVHAGCIITASLLHGCNINSLYNNISCGPNQVAVHPTNRMRYISPTSFHASTNLMEKLFYCNPIPFYKIAINFCTCRSCIPILPCAKFCNDQFTGIWMKA